MTHHRHHRWWCLTQVVLLDARGISSGATGRNGGLVRAWATATFCGQNSVSVGSQSGQHDVFSGRTHNRAQYVDTRLVLQLCGSSGPTGHPRTPISYAWTTQRRAQVHARAYAECLPGDTATHSKPIVKQRGNEGANTIDLMTLVYIIYYIERRLNIFH